MTTLATRIRDAAYDRLSAIPGYAKKRKTQVPQIQPEQLPSLSVYITGENLSPDGDGNVGEPRFEAETTIAISVVRGFAENGELMGDIDADVDAIEARLLSDPTFVGFGPGVLFEAITRISRRRLFPQQGETYFAELRLEMTFLTRVSYPPIVTDDLDRVRITTRQLGSGPDTPALMTEIDLITP